MWLLDGENTKQRSGENEAKRENEDDAFGGLAEFVSFGDDEADSTADSARFRLSICLAQLFEAAGDKELGSHVAECLDILVDGASSPLRLPLSSSSIVSGNHVTPHDCCGYCCGFVAARRERMRERRQRCKGNH